MTYKRRLSIAEKLDRSRNDVLDLSLRNPLLNFRVLRANGLRIVDEVPREIFRILVRRKQVMYFQPASVDIEGSPTAVHEEVPEELLSLMVEAEGSSDQLADRHVDNKLQTPYRSDLLAVRLRNTYRRAHLSIEEQGVNILYLALGTLNWFESDTSSIQRIAPLLLVPVELKKASTRARFNVRWTDEEINGNLSLETMLKADFSIDLPQLPEAEDLDVDGYFSGVVEAVSSQSRWSVDTKAINLGFFSFSKLLIYKDLDSKSWPEGRQPGDHHIVQSLYSRDGFREDPPAIAEDDHLDELLKVSDIHPVLDSDSSQTLAVCDVKRGRNLVIQGPPGTGKSQTITNMIAEAIADDKTVLFVAEKMAALEVVKRRLDSVHIGDACLELHSHTANKRAVLEELKRTLELGEPQFGNIEGDRYLLEKKRDRLNEYAWAVNDPIGKTGLSPNELIGRVHQIKTSHPVEDWPVLEMEGSTDWSRQAFNKRRELIRELQALVKAVGMPSEHTYWESGCWRYTDRDDIRAKLNAALCALRGWRDHVSSLCALLEPNTDYDNPDRAKVATLANTARRVLEAPFLRDVNHRTAEWILRSVEIETVARQALELAEIHDTYSPVLTSEAWDRDVSENRHVLLSVGGKWWRGLSGKYRRSRNQVRALFRSNPPGETAEQVAVVDAVLRVQHLRKSVDDHKKLLLDLFSGGELVLSFSGYKRLGDVFCWVLDLHADTSAGELDANIHNMLDRTFDKVELKTMAAKCEKADSDLLDALRALERVLEWREDRSSEHTSLVGRAFSSLESWITTAMRHVDTHREIIRFNQMEKAAKELGLGSVVNVAALWMDSGENLVDLFELVCFRTWIDDGLRKRPVLFELDAAVHEDTINEFRRLDEAIFGQNRALVAQRHWKRVPHQQGGGQRGVLQREFQKKRRHLPLRKLMLQAGHAIQQIKPVFMMSPLSIAKFIPPDSVYFDLVIFDEASQIRPVEAIGAVIRSRQAVVVGDTKQLPPTHFFDRLDGGAEDDEERSETTDLESILGMFSAQGAPERMLRWHYRSQHESLITVSNHEFYDNRLVVFPSPDKGREDTGLRLQHGPNLFYKRGRGGRINVGEAQVVARAVMEHARHSPEMTLGVAAFSLSQARRIEDEVEILRRRDGSCEDFFVAHPHEPFFVKNLETVQGDERDVILISVGYGRVEGGYFSMNFGPLNKDGGERRLNVLITRARRRCDVYSNFLASDLDMRRTKARGVESLKAFLHYAETGVLDAPRASGRDADSPFEVAVATALRNRGYDIEHQVGSAGFFIDLAVVDPQRPGRYLLGIECDGASYHSARSARDRDRLRQQVLEGLHWTIHRIWSTDWYLDPGRELAKAEEAIRRAAEEAPVKRPSGRSREATPLRRASTNDIDADRSGVVPYRRMSPRVTLRGHDLHEVPTQRMLFWVLEVVEVESPIHIQEVARRIAKSAGYGRVGKRIRGRVALAVDRGVFEKKLLRKGSFLWRPSHERILVRRRDKVPPELRKPDVIAREEIGAALLYAVQVSYGIGAEDAVVEASRLFGFRRTGTDIRKRFQSTLGSLISRGILEERRGFLFFDDE